ncbi:hypothetical protein ABIB40_001884 [Pedobacter sp. UYP30]|uniref:hypothetical protein n=1 Tax=Pedobacter sp. UYP30 TaxID=1756400 RepID=UPI00339107FC
MRKALSITCFLGFCFIFISNQSFAQKPNEIVPLYKFFQENADSTIVLTHDQGSIFEVVDYLIISKSKGIVTLYRYGSPYSRLAKTKMPTEIRAFFRKRDFKVSQIKADTNAYFNVRDISLKKAEKLWKRINSFRPWRMKDDSVDGEGCPTKTDKSNAEVFDGGKVFL